MAILNISVYDHNSISVGNNYTCYKRGAKLTINIRYSANWTAIASN